MYATGPGSHVFAGTVEQSYVAHAIAHAACMGHDARHCEKPPSDDAAAAKLQPHNFPSMGGQNFPSMTANYPILGIPSYPSAGSPVFPNAAPNIYHETLDGMDEGPASAPVEERKVAHDPHQGKVYPHYVQSDPHSGRTNGFNTEFHSWSAASKLRGSLVLTVVPMLVLLLAG